ncbi:MAG TPA: stage II sporulation protein M, partial [Firmicutes bacterium]|nr:stage II sporulation protein M [Bacillota bacterium]
SIWPFLCLGILPHGVFELSAFFICGALGLKFGYHCVASPLPGLSRKQSFFYIWREVISIMPLILTLLAIAAVVEIYISQVLLFKYLKM